MKQKKNKRGLTKNQIRERMNSGDKAGMVWLGRIKYAELLARGGVRLYV